MQPDKLAKRGIPVQTMIRLPQVIDMVGLGKTAIYAHIKAGDFPKPAKFGRSSVWSEQEINNWIESRFNARFAA